MTKEEILSGLKNAIEKGESLEKAKQSFINAGYNANEVQSAASMLGGILTEYPETIPNPRLPQRAFIPQSEQPAPQNQIPIEKFQPVSKPLNPLPTQRIPEKKSRKGIIIFLIILFLILTGGLIIIVLFKDKVLEFINSLF